MSHSDRVATGDYFFITLTTSTSKKIYFTWRGTKKKLQLLLFWKSGSKSNKKNSRLWQPCSDLQKYICYENGINNFNFSCTGSHKKLWMHHVQCIEMTRRMFSVESCVFTFFYINRREYWFSANLRFPVFDGFLGCLEHDLTISGKCLSVSVWQKFYVKPSSRTMKFLVLSKRKLMSISFWWTSFNKWRCSSTFSLNFWDTPILVSSGWNCTKIHVIQLGYT